ncbi:MAG TPA: phage tail protein [Niastella sp.]
MTLPGLQIPGGWQQMPTAVPVGSLIAFAGKISPLIKPGDQPPAVYPVSQPAFTTDVESQGWMVCDGRSLDINTYNVLYQVIGDQYNTGDMQGKFCIPDYRGYFLRMVDMDSGNDPDSKKRLLANGDASDEVGSIQQDALQEHVHMVNTQKAPTILAGDKAAAINSQPDFSGKAVSDNAKITVRTSLEETRPKNVYVYYLIKFLPG